MLIANYKQLRAPILESYRVLAPFGLTPGSPQSLTLEVDLKASFSVHDKDLLSRAREPNRRILMDFFCLPFRDTTDIPAEFPSDADFESQLEQWRRDLQSNPNDYCLAHRVAVGFHHQAWTWLERRDYDRIYAALEAAVACWAIVLASEDYISSWRKARVEVFATKKVALMFGVTFVEELLNLIDSDIRELTEHPEVVRFSPVRSQRFAGALSREFLTLKIATRIGGIRGTNGRTYVCGRLGIDFFKQRLAAAKRAKMLHDLHPDAKTSYLANVGENASDDERLKFDAVLDFRLAFFDLGGPFFDIRMDRHWVGIRELARLAGVDTLSAIESLTAPPGSLFYPLADDNGELFEADFWHLVKRACKSSLTVVGLKKRPDYDAVRREVQRVKEISEAFPDQDEFWKDISEVFLARQMAVLLSCRKRMLKPMMHAVALLELLVKECPESEIRVQMLQSIGSACGNISAVFFNLNQTDLSLKYIRRCLECTPDNMKRMEEALTVFRQKIAETPSMTVRSSIARQLMQLLENCASHNKDNERFDVLLRRARRLLNGAKPDGDEMYLTA